MKHTPVQDEYGAKNAKKVKIPKRYKQNWVEEFKKELPLPKNTSDKGGRPREELKEIINAIFHVVREGCSWRALPHDFPN